MSYDVIVVGARCAGAATAMLLARAGLSVLAIDRARYGSDTLSTHALTLPAVLQLSRWGLLDRIRAAGTPRVNKVVQHYGDDCVEIAIRPRDEVDGLYAPRRYVLDRVLADAACEAGAEVRHRVGMKGLIFQGDRAAGVILDDNSTVRARFVVGADGKQSPVARHVNADVLYTAPYSSATAYTFVDGLPSNAYVNYFRPGIGAGLIPTNSGQANAWISLPRARMPHSRAHLAKLFADTLPHLTTAGPYRTFVGRKGFLRQCWGSGWALVGDAAYFKDSLSAHGITDAMIGAELLTEALLSIANGADEAKSLGAYALQRWRLIAPMMPAVEHIASFRWDAASLQQAHRNINAAMRAEWDFLAAHMMFVR